MALENESMNKESIEKIDRFIIDAVEYIRKKSKKRTNKPTIIDYVFNENNSINVDKQVVEKRITFLTTNGTLGNKPNSNKNSFRVKKTRQNWHQMTLLIILQHHQKSSIR